MNIIWLGTTRKAFDIISSYRFGKNEIVKYKLKLLDRIERKIHLMETSIPVKHLDWRGSFKVTVGKYIVYYSFSDNKETCYIEYFKHMSQINELER